MKIMLVMMFVGTSAAGGVLMGTWPGSGERIAKPGRSQPAAYVYSAPPVYQSSGSMPNVGYHASEAYPQAANAPISTLPRFWPLVRIKPAEPRPVVPPPPQNNPVTDRPPPYLAFQGAGEVHFFIRYLRPPPPATKSK